MLCVLKKLKKRATSLSSFPFFSASVISTLEDFVFSAFEIMSLFPFFALLPSCCCTFVCVCVCVGVHVCVCVTWLASGGSNTDVLIEIQRLAA